MSLETKNKLKRWIRTFIGIFLLGAGVALATVPEMGTDPLAGFDEVLSEIKVRLDEIAKEGGKS